MGCWLESSLYINNWIADFATTQLDHKKGL